ncbi:MAG: DUF4340 domain-containing protein [Anaerolineae bacterium]|nr:DUF4340 domain-containing protein [Anaerolineae bacterium]
MQTRNRLISGLVLLGVAAALITTFVLLGKREEEPEVDETAEAETVDLFPDAVFGVVEAFSVTDNETGDTFAASIDEDSFEWVIDEMPTEPDPALVVDSNQITSSLFSLPSLQSSRVLSEIEALAPFGLEEAHYTITFRVTSGGEHTIYVGSQNPTGTGYYVRLTESVDLTQEVYLVDTYSLDSVIWFLENPPLIEPTPEEEQPEGA